MEGGGEEECVMEGLGEKEGKRGVCICLCVFYRTDQNILGASLETEVPVSCTRIGLNSCASQPISSQ